MKRRGITKAKYSNRYVNLGFIVLIVIGILYISFISRNSFLATYKSHHELKKMQKQVEQIQKKNRELNAVNRRLAQDPKEVEKIAREKMGMQKQGEKVYRFIDD